MCWRREVLIPDLRLIAAAIAAVLLIASHAWAYIEGRANGKALLDRAVAEQTAKALEQERAARGKERALLEAKQKAEVKYEQAKRQAASAATNAVSELDRLRNELAASNAGQPTQDPTAGTRAVSRPGLESELLGHCAQALTGMASEADRLEALVVGLQAYVKNVCLADRGLSQ